MADRGSIRDSFKAITIIGVGLIGGSLGLAIKQRFPTARICGVDRTTVLRAARKKGAIDAGETSIARAVQSADLIILATPLAVIQKLLPRVAKHCSPQSVVTDVGSVKLSIVRPATRHFPHGNFIGGHPMAGAELTGIEAAHPLLFENAAYVLTPTKANPAAIVRRFAAFLERLGARVVLLDPKMHDEIASAVSHLPQLTAVALMNVVGGRRAGSRRHLQLAAGGFRDLTRIASSRPDIWKDILSLNRKEIQRSVQLLIRELELYLQYLQKNSSPELISRFRRARQIRNRIPKTMKGFLHPLAEVYVFLKDQPGMLARMTAALAQANINIKDLELMKVREGSSGTFRLAFESREVAVQALKVLRRKGFEIGR